MKGRNRCEFIGNLGADPKMEYLSSGTARCAWSMAINESWKDRDGNPQERTEWVHVVAWGKLAEACGKYLAKGRPVLVDARYHLETWEKDGEKQSRPTFVALEVTFLGSGETTASGPQEQENTDDDIPF